MTKIAYPDNSHSSSMVSGTEMSPRPHPEKLSRSPLPAGDHQASNGEVIQKLPQTEDQRIPSTPDSITDRSRKDKQRVQGKFGVASPGHDYKLEPVRDAVPKKRTDSVPHHVGAGDDRRNRSNTSSFGGKKYAE